MSVVDSWEQYYRTMSGIAAEMIGASRHFAKNPNYATDAVVAATFRKYAERMEGVEVPS